MQRDHSLLEDSIGGHSGIGSSYSGFSTSRSAFSGSQSPFRSTTNQYGYSPFGGTRGRAGGPPMLFAALLAGRSEKTKKRLTIVGIIMVIGGLLCAAYGFISFTINMTSFNFNQQMIYAILFPLGFFVFVIGLMLVYYCQLRRITSYIATETAPAVTTVTHAAGEGIMGGINEAGGIQINTTGAPQKEVIKIKCPHCGYLESEDATFCSKCGNKI